jgi:hypothetical protein
MYGDPALVSVMPIMSVVDDGWWMRREAVV